MKLVMKRFFLTALSLILSMVSIAQSPDNGPQSRKTNDNDGSPHSDSWYENQWNALDKLQNAASLNSAYDKACNLFATAQREHNSRQTLTGAFYLGKIEFAYRENPEDSVLARYKSILPTLEPVDQALCQAFLAHFYWNYRDAYNREISNNKETDQKDLDYKLWPVSRFNAAIQHCMEGALRNTALLRNTPSSSLSRLLEEDRDGKHAIELTPTLYDVLVEMAIDVLGDDAASYARKEALLDEQIQFHAEGDTDDCLTIHLYQHKLRLLDLKPNHRQGDGLALLDQLIARFQGTQCPLLASLYYDKANRLNAAGDYVGAVAACDEGCRLFPRSEGGADCANLRSMITSPGIDLRMQADQLENRDMLAQVKVRNAHHLYFRIVKFKNRSSVSGDRAFLAKLPVLKSWQQELELRTDYSYQQVVSYLPAMPAGKYYVLVSHSADFAREGMVCNTITVCDAVLISVGEREEDLSFCLLNRVSGEPIKDVDVTLRTRKWDDKDKVVATATTDKEGIVTFPGKSIDFLTYAEYTYHGVSIAGDRIHRSPVMNQDTTVRWSIFLDRPVYKPGESVSFMAVNYKTDRHRFGQTLQGKKVTVSLRDVNRTEHKKLDLVTDAFGQVHGSFALPEDALPGNWGIQLEGGTEQSFPVQYYKQPRYAVQLPVDSAEHQFGKPVEVKGNALSYTDMPVEGAKVEWSVVREQVRPLWRWWGMPPVSAPVTVADGSTVTVQDGTFSFSFVPQPDSGIDLSAKPCFRYEITARVTDLNGEVHEQTRTLCVGYENSGIVLSDIDMHDFSKIKYQYVNLDNQPLEGDVQVLVEELRKPAEPKLPTGLESGYSQSMSKEEFSRRYPYYAYSDDELNVSGWSVARTVLRTTHHASSTSPNEVALPKLASGVYRVSISTVNGQGDTVKTSEEYVFTAPGERRVQCPALLWHQLSAYSAEVGDTLTLRVGTSFKDVEVLYALVVDNVRQQYRRLHLGNEITAIKIPVTEEMRGGFAICLFTAKEGAVSEVHRNIEVPYGNKKLDVRFVTFRDRLKPGQKETWTLQVDAPSVQDCKAANLLLTMYDAALDTYGNLSWSLNPWSNNRNDSYLWYVYSNSVTNGINYLSNVDMISGKALSLSCYRLRAGSFRYYGLYTTQYNVGAVKRKVTGMGRVRFESEAAEQNLQEDVTVAGAEYVMEESVSRMADGIGDVPAEKYALYSAMQEMQLQRDSVAFSSTDDQSSRTPVQVRRNLGTLACFEPTLRTDSTGRVSLTFTVPELLTRWHVQGLAYNRQLQAGTVQATAVTSKEIMVVPDVPRFLRQGDRIDFGVKVSNATDEQQDVEVVLELADAATGRTFFSQSQNHNIREHGSCPVSFSLSVPDDIFACTYRVVACSRSHSDGEQDVIPVLTNRMLVTESMSMYVNGKGDRRYTMQPLQRDLGAVESGKNTTLQPHRLTVEFTANPIWYAIQALPYVEDHANPSNIYLVNSIYVNTLGSSIVRSNPEVGEVFAQWTEEEPDALTSKLQQNEDVKQTILQETPWLRNGTDEAARMHRVGAFFDQRSLNKNINKAASELNDAQRSDGSWSWMPGGSQSSEYVTGYVLKTYGHMAALQDKDNRMSGRQGIMLRKALRYMDQENYKYYQECRKHPGWTPANIDYLYMRSFYPGESFTGDCRTSYDFFYNNALNGYKDYNGLYTQAQLALIFHRHGDTKAARDLVRRIRERSLTNDEMGMYWRDNVSGFFRGQRPIEVQSLLIEAFEEVTPQDVTSPALMRQWLLKQKQTTSWNSDIATVNAIVALAGNNQAVLRNTEERANAVTVKVGGRPLTAPGQSATGYQRRQWQGDSIHAGQSDVVISKSTDGIAWGAMYWQYFEDLDKVPYSEMGIKLQKTLYRENNDGSLSVVEYNGKSGAKQHSGGSGPILKIGDKVRVRILIDCDRTLEYLELKDARPAVFEPVATESGWRWNDGLSYYTAVYNASTGFFIDRMEKGKYVLEYTMYVTGSGQSLSCGNATIQCMYAPEFRCNTQGQMLSVISEQ